MPSHNIAEYIYHFSYLGIFLWFAFLEQLTPVPEEVSLISLGYISMHSSIDPLIGGFVAITGLLSADSLFFYLSLKGNKIIKRIMGKTSNKLINTIRQDLQRDTRKTLIIMALLPKLRFLSPIISANFGISWKYFFSINSIATMFYVTVYLIIGIFFQKQLQTILHELELWQHIIFVFIMILVAISLVFMIRKFILKKYLE